MPTANILIHPTTLIRLCPYQSTLVSVTASDGTGTNVGKIRHSPITPAEKYRELVPQSLHAADMHETYVINDPQTIGTPNTNHRVTCDSGQAFRVRHVQRWPANAADNDVYYWRLFLEPIGRML